MKILVAGGAGYIGSRLVPALLKQGYEVDVIDLLWFGNNLPENIKVIKKDLFDCKEEDLKGYDQVIFLAGLSNDPMAEFSPAKNFIDNAALPAYLAFQAKKAKVKRFIYASSCSVYGQANNKYYDENDPVNSDYPYGISKLQGERGCCQLQDDDFSVIALRQGTVCGFSPRMRMDLIVNTMFKTAMTDNKIVINNASIWRPIFDIRDAVDAYSRAIVADRAISGVFNVASGNYTIQQVGEAVKKEVERLAGRRIDMEIKNIQDFRNYRVDTNKAQKILGFQPESKIEDIVDDLYRHLKEIGDFDQDKYYNIRIFKKLVM
jgi:nucleoside-diphosphate-sugar epimerase